MNGGKILFQGSILSGTQLGLIKPAFERLVNSKFASEKYYLTYMVTD